MNMNATDQALIYLERLSKCHPLDKNRRKYNLKRIKLYMLEMSTADLVAFNELVEEIL